MQASLLTRLRFVAASWLLVISVLAVPLLPAAPFEDDATRTCKTKGSVSFAHHFSDGRLPERVVAQRVLADAPVPPRAANKRYESKASDPASQPEKPRVRRCAHEFTIEDVADAKGHEAEVPANVMIAQFTDPIPQPVISQPAEGSVIPKSFGPSIPATDQAVRVNGSPSDPLISLVEFREGMMLGEATRYLGRLTNINFVASPGAAQVDVSSVYLRNVTLTQALDVMATTFGLFYKRDPASNVIFIHANSERDLLEPDPEQLAREINAAFPNSYVELSLVGDKILVRGQAKDVIEAEQIIKIIAQSALATKEPQPQAVNVNVSQSQGGLAAFGATPDTGTATRSLQQSIRNSLIPGYEGVINMLEIPGVQQVMLRVIVAEVNREAARSIGLNFSVPGDGVNDVAARSLVGPINNLSGGNSLNFDPTNNFMGMLLGTPIMLDNLPVSIGDDLSLAINALRDTSLARTLAEPNLTAMNGEKAVFHAGGRFPVPVLSGFSNGTQGVTFQPFGVQLEFTPLILDRDRVRLNVNAEVSVRAADLGTSIGGTTDVPGIDSRSFSTTVELTDGQTLAVAGLIKNDYGANGSRIPFVGDLPVIGRLASFDSTISGEQELVILVTPELVQPIRCGEHPALPGSDVYEPSDVEFYLFGKLESDSDNNYRTAARTDLGRKKSYYSCQERLILGPSGYTNVCEGSCP